jgi:cobyrinic acid a,c-diamide synthase
MKGLVIAGTHSGCGKTTVTLGLMAALKKRKLIVQPFKSGPDFIDAGLHRLVTGRPSRNLDLWMCGEDYVKKCFRRHSTDADISVVEGVMGLYDGGLSTAALAGCLDIPVVLVVDAYGMAETAGAIVKGIRDMDSAPRFAGVIFNRVASESHFKRLRESVTDMPALGYLPRDLNFEIPHRHLGLTTAEDNPIAGENIDRLADAVAKYIDIEWICNQTSPSPQSSHSRGEDVLCSSPPLRGGDEGAGDSGGFIPGTMSKSKLIKLAVARDRAFCFYYEDNLDLLKEAGAELAFFSPLADKHLPPDIHGVYIGGGYPELHAEQLSLNRSMLKSVRDWAESDGAIYAECGGLMYLSKGIRTTENEAYEMSGIFPFETVMKKSRSRLGYREIGLTGNCLIGSVNSVARGHEFHYSEIMEGQAQDVNRSYSVKGSSGDMLSAEGYTHKKTLASYVHLHFGSNPCIAGALISSCRRER